MMSDSRICFVGDSLVQGTGDQTGLGWPGRLLAVLNRNDFVATGYNLGIRRETSDDIKQRWRTECDRRLPESVDNYLVFSFGVNDTTVVGGKLRVSKEDSIRNMQDIIKRAADMHSTIMIGPTPVTDREQSKRIAQLDAAYQTVAQDISVPYLSVFDSLSQSAVWLDEMRAGDGSHPGQGGYQLLSELIRSWSGWWFRKK